MIRQIYQGRTGNILLQVVGLSILAERLNYKVQNYNNLELFTPLGLKVFNDGDIDLREHSTKQDDSLINILVNGLEERIGIIYDGTYQVKDFVLNYREKIKSHFEPLLIRNENLFVHVRLGDVSYLNPGIEYYRKSIQKCDYKYGYISSDSPDNQIIKRLSDEFSLEIIKENDPIKIINFARQSKFLVLSRGTFSWWIGLLSKAEKIYVPGGKGYPNKSLDFTGDIFVYDDWIYED